MIKNQSSLNRKARMERLALIKQRHRSLILRADVEIDEGIEGGLDDDMDFTTDDE